MHYQVYIPKAADVQFELTKVGLADHVPNAEVLPVGDGPDGQGGAIFSWLNEGKPRRMHFSAKDSDWVPAPDKRYWVGLWKDECPQPEDLVRAHDAGRRMPLGDGHTWLVPAVDAAEREMIVDAEGRRTFAIPKRFESLQKRQIHWREWVLNRVTGGNFTVREEIYWQWFDLAVDALRLNYRITPEVVAALRLFNTSNVIATFNAICGDMIEARS